MGYCTYGGKPVPINDQAGCIGGGGNWVDDIAPIQRGGVNIMHPYSQANNDQLTALSNVTGAGTLGKVVPRIGAGLPGRFTGQPNTVQQVQKAAQPIQGPAQQKLTDIGKINPDAYKNTLGYKIDNFVYNKPVTAAAGVAGVAVPAYNMFNAGEPVTDKKVVQNNTPVNQQSPLVTKEELKAKNIALMNAKNAGDTTAVNEILAGKTNKINANGLLAPMPVIPRPEGTQGPLSETGSFNPSNKLGGGFANKNAPANKSEVEGGLSNLWSNMQKPGYWSDQVKGGAGDWDTRLFRLSEMMTHMGTPLSKRGKSPADRWTTATATANKAATDAAAAKAKADKKKTPIDLFSKNSPNIIGDTIAEDLKKVPWFLDTFGQEYSDEEAVQMGKKGQVIYMEYLQSGASPKQAMKETMKEIQLGL